MSDFNDGIEKALEAIQNLRHSGAANFLDARYAGQRGVDHADALYDAYQKVKALKRPTPDRSEARERIARIIYDKNPHYEPGEYVDGHQVSPGGDLSWEQACARDAEFGEDASFGVIVNLTKEPFEIADRILATGLVQDEASIRADEREKCAVYIEQRPGSIPDRQEIAAAIRKGGSK